MKPSTKFAAVRVLHEAGDEGLWEHEVFGRLEGEYPATELAGLRDQLVGLSSIGWLEVLDEAEYQGIAMRRFALYPSMRSFVEYQLGQGFFRGPAPAGATHGGGGA